VLSKEGSNLIASTDSRLNVSVASIPSITEENKVHRLSKHYLVTDFDAEMTFSELNYRVCSEFAMIQPLELVDVAWQKKDKDRLAPNVLLSNSLELSY
jgi:hypothetical protein